MLLFCSLAVTVSLCWCVTVFLIYILELINLFLPLCCFIVVFESIYVTDCSVYVFVSLDVTVLFSLRLGIYTVLVVPMLISCCNYVTVFIYICLVIKKHSIIMCCSLVILELIVVAVFFYKCFVINETLTTSVLISHYHCVNLLLAWFLSIDKTIDKCYQSLNQLCQWCTTLCHSLHITLFLVVVIYWNWL